MSDLDASYVLWDARVCEKLYAFVRGNWSALAAKQTPMVVHLMAYSSQRTISQNKLYWRLLQDIAETAWIDGRQFSKDAWHETFRHRFLPRAETPEGELPVSTASLTVREFTDYINRVESYAATELGLEV